MPDSPVILSRQLINRALLDAAFYQQLPEFSTLKPKMSAMGIDLAKKDGCRGCDRSRVEQNLSRDFMFVVSSLNSEGIERLKAYFGCGSMMFNAYDPKTGRFGTKII